MAQAKRLTEGKKSLRWLVGTMVVLAGLLLWDWQSDNVPPGGKLDGAPASLRNAETVPSVNPLAGLNLDALRDTIARPLFEKHRRPVEPAARAAPKLKPALATAAQQAPDQNALTLLGVVVGQGRKTALFKRTLTGQDVRVEEGDTIDGWTVKRIEGRHVILTDGDRKILLQLFRK